MVAQQGQSAAASCKRSCPPAASARQSPAGRARASGAALPAERRCWARLSPKG